MMGKPLSVILVVENRALSKAEWVDIPTAINTIHAAGGVAIIAHPMRYNMTGKWIRRLIVDF